MRFLDYQKVKDAERNKARELFGTPEEMTELANKVRLPPRLEWEWGLMCGIQIVGTKSKVFDVAGSAAAAASGGATASRLSRLKLTDKERKKLQDLIKKADSLEEIIRLEKALNEGRLPPGVMVDEDAMEE